MDTYLCVHVAVCTCVSVVGMSSFGQAHDIVMYAGIYTKHV